MERDKRFICTVSFSVPLFEEDNEIEGEEMIIPAGSEWEQQNKSIIGGDVHLEQVDYPWNWLEISNDRLKECFVEKDGRY